MERQRSIVAALMMAVLSLLAATGFRSAKVEPERPAVRPVVLQAEGYVGPGSMLTLQTASGPMQLTVDSQMNPAGYVHAYGYENGQMYAGYVHLAAQNPAAQQALAAAPSQAQAQLSQYPIADPYTRQAAYSGAAYQWAGGGGGGLQTVEPGRQVEQVYALGFRL